MAFQSNNDRDRVLEATDLVDLIGSDIPLQPKGRDWVGRCPFHDDSKPSMRVVPEKQIYWCFPCGSGGSAFDWMMNFHKLDFIEALKALAERAGVELTPFKPERGGGTPQDPGQPSERKRIADANGKTHAFFRMLLGHDTHGAEARAYLDRRGVTAEMIEAFELGYAPDGWDGLAKTIDAKGWAKKDFELAQVIKARSQGDGHFDFLRHRLVFPILDALGRPIAFGGRVLRDEDDPKYLNSPETPLFNKSATLYGLHAAKKPIIDSKTAVIVEGYTDVIACHQAGATNVVAALGTALTGEHVRTLRRYCEQVVLVMDGDAAGQKAADRAVEVFLAGDLDVSMAVLPGGQDPDELLAAGGLDAWNAVLADACDALEFAHRRTAAKMDAQDTLTGRQRVAEAFLNQVVDLGLARTGRLRRSLVVGRLAKLLRIGEDEVDAILRERSPRSSRKLVHSPPPQEVPTDHGEPWGPDSEPLDSGDNDENYVHSDIAARGSGSKLKKERIAERRFIAGLVRYNGLFATTLDDGRGLDEALAPGDFVDANLGRLYQRVYDTLAEGGGLTAAGMLTDLAAEGDLRLSAVLAQAVLELPASDAPPAPHEPANPAPAPPPADLLETWHAALQSILLRHRERQYEQDRRALNGVSNPTAGDAAGIDPVRLAQRLAEYRRNHPSPARMPRPKR